MGKTKRTRSGIGKEEGREMVAADDLMPRKKFYRQRAHCNPLNDTSMDTPLTPDDIDWSQHYPAYVSPDGSAKGAGPAPQVTIADVGCGFGGMTIALAKLYPESLVLGLEIRMRVTEYVKQKIIALRHEHSESQAYQNASVVRANTMKYMANYIKKAQLEKLFFLFPDPHFKAANHRRRIVNTQLLTEYAYFLKPGGIVYTITDVEDLGVWMRTKLSCHPMFEEMSEEELASDPAAQLLHSATEEGQKVARNNGSTWRACFRRRPAPLLTDASAACAAAPAVANT